MGRVYGCFLPPEESIRQAYSRQVALIMIPFPLHLLFHPLYHFRSLSIRAPHGERLLRVLGVNGLPEIGSGFHRMHPLCSKQCHIVLIGVTLLTPPPAVPQLTMAHNVPWSPSSYRVLGLWIRVLQIPMCRSITRRRSFTCTV